MPQKPKIFKKDDQIFDVPSKEVTSFLDEVPGAVEINVYEKDGVTYDVPVSDLDAFMQEVPGAILKEGSKKKASSPESGADATRPGRSSMGLSPLPASTGRAIIDGEPEKDPILQRASAKSPWLAAPINFLTGAVKGTGAHIMKPLDGAQKLFYKGIGSLMEMSSNPTIMAEGMKLKKQQDDPNHRSWFKNAEDGIDLYAKNRLPEEDKDDFFSALVYNLGELAPFMGTLLATPNPSLFGVGMKLPVNIGGQSAMSTYADTGDLGEAVKQGAIGIGDGAMLMTMGYGGQMGSKWIAGNLKSTFGAAAETFGATAGAGIMYGGGLSTNITKQLISGTDWENLDWDAANQEGALFFALGVPGIVNSAASRYAQAPNEALAFARRFDVEVEVGREKAFELFEKAEKETDPAKKKEYLLAAESLNNMMDIKFMDEYLGKNKEEAIKFINESDMSEAAKKKMIESAEEAELYQQQLEQTKDLQTAGDKIKETEAAKADKEPEIRDKVEEKKQKDAKFNKRTLELLDKVKEEGGASNFIEAMANIEARAIELRKEGKTEESSKLQGLLDEINKNKYIEKLGPVNIHSIDDIKEDIPQPEKMLKMKEKMEPGEAKKPEDMIAEHEKSGGATFDVSGKNLAGSDKSSVGIFPERTKVVKGELKPEDINKFKEDNKDLLEGNEDVLGIGTWKKAEGEHVLDITALTSREKAIELGKQYNQESVYDLKTGELIETGGTGAPVEGVKPEIDRVNDLKSRAGQQNEAFFTEKSKEASSDVPYEPVIKIDKETPTAKAYEVYSSGGNFTGHISKMIPGFQEKQIKVAEAVTKSGAKSFLDIGASEGGLAKTVASQNTDMRAVAVDPNSQMKKNFESTPEVKNVEFKQEAFQGSWTEADGTKINEFKPKEKFDVVNEDFTFQFVNNERAKQVAGVKELMTEDGIFISSEKFHTENKAANEAKKADHQKKYFTPEERTADKEGIVTGMDKDMVKDTEYFDILKDNFKYVEEFWNAGEFKGFVASDSKSSINNFKKNVGDLTTEFTDKGSRTAPGGPPAKVPPKPPKPPKGGDKELPEGEGKKPEKDGIDLMKDIKKERTRAMKARKALSKLRPSYLFYDQQEPFKRAVQKGARVAKKGKELAQRVLDRKNTEKGSKARTAMEFSAALKDVTGGITGFGPKHMELISDINDMRRTKELYKSREAVGKDDILMEGGASLKQAEDFLDKVMKKDPRVLEMYGIKDYDPKKLREASDKFNDKYRGILDELLSEGLVRQEAYDQIVFEHPYYSPRKFVESLDKMDPGGSLSGVESLKGGSEGAKIVDAPSLLFDAISRKNGMVARARTFRAMEDYIKGVGPDFLKQAEYSPDFLNKMKDAGEGLGSGDVSLLGIGEPGAQKKPKWIEPEFKDTPKGMEPIDYIDANGNKRRMWMDANVHKYFDIEPFGDLSRKIMNYAGWISGTKPLKMAATGYNPEFMVKNIPIDMMHILNTTDVYSGALPVAYAQMSVDMARVARDVISRSGTYTDYINEGGGMKMLTGEGRLREGVSRHKLNKATQFAEAVEGLASWPGESSELITRLSLRWRHLENAKSRFAKENGREPTPKEVKEMQLDATAYARNYLDFEQGGRLIKMADSVIPYLNAGFQVTRGSLRAAGKNPGLYAAKVAQVAGVAAGITAWNMGQVQTKNIDEEKSSEMRRFYLNDISDEVKARNFVVMTPLKYTDVNGIEKYLYFKLQKDNAQELITGVAEDRVHRELMGDNAPSYLSSRRLKELQIMTESTTNVAQLPPAVRGALGYKLNKDFFYNSDLWMGYDMGKDKSGEYRRDTPERYKAMGKIPLPGGNKLSPMRTHYVAKQFFTESNVIATGVGEMMDRVIGGASPDLKTEYTPDDVEKLKNTPFARRFLKSTYPGASKQGGDTYQQEYNRMKQDHNRKLEALIDSEAPSEEVFKWLGSIVEDGDGDITSIKENERLMRRYKDEVLVPSVNSWVERLKYTDAIPRGQELFDQWVHMDDDMRNALMESAAVAGVLSEATITKFTELVNEYEQEMSKVDSENAANQRQPEKKPNPKPTSYTPDIPSINDVKGVDVDMEVEIEETGKRENMKVSALEARKDIKRRYNAIDQLIQMNNES